MMIDFDIDDGDDDDYDDVDDIDDDNATTMMIIWYDFDDDDNDNEDDDEPCIDEFPLSALVVFPLHCCSRHCSPFHLLIDLALIWPEFSREWKVFHFHLFSPRGINYILLNTSDYMLNQQWAQLFWPRKENKLYFFSPGAKWKWNSKKIALSFQDFNNVCQVLIAGGAVRTAFPKGKGFIETSMENYLGCIAEVWIALT